MMKHILSSRRVGHLSFFLGCLSLHGPQFGLAFIPRAVQHHRPTFLFSTTSEEVAKMRAGEIKKELESYGISTKSFLEKTELVEALEKARAEGLKPKPEASTTTRKKARTRTTTEATDTSSSSSSSSSSSASASSSPKDTRPREIRFAEELEKCQAMKAMELKKELEERGVSTKSFFEKSEFAKALADARVDGIAKPKEGYAEYSNVEVLTDASAGPRPKQAAGKDQQSKQQQQQQSPFGGGAAGANPFAGMGDMGGMGGMGGIADLLKNMGGAAGPAAGANPFAGMGGGMGGMGGMGDMMGKAQQMMKNPKVMEIMAKAQKNPKIMKAMQEVMGNPAAAAKYQNDPEVAELMNELKKYI